MTKIIQNGRRAASVPAMTTRAKQVLSPEDLARANRWRDALRQLLDHHQVSPAELARRINAPNPNFLYNFFNSRSHSLAQDTLERICRALPGTEISDLFGVPRQQSATCRIIAEAITGVAQDSFVLPPERQQVLPLPGSLGHDPEVFGVWVGLSGSGWLYPAGAILLCRPYSGQGDDLQGGCRVIVQRPLGDGVEVTVRELTAGLRGPAQALARLHRVQLPIGATILLSGVVIASWRPEAALIAS